MMELTVGDKLKEKVIIPSELYHGTFKPKSVEFVGQNEVVNEAISKPIDTPILSMLAKGKISAAIIISDSTRGIPNHIVLPPIICELQKAGLTKDQIKIYIAVGLHREATPEELQIIREQSGGVEAISHDASAEEALAFLGYSKDQTPIYINKEVYAAQIKVTIGKVEPHEFAGFTGGRKSIIPGVAGEKTINWNHRPERLEHPDCVPGKLTDNPIHEDMEEIALKVGVDFSLQVILNEQDEVMAAFAGSLVGSHEKAVELSRELADVDVVNRPNLIVCHPGNILEINLYQALKAVFAAAEIIEDNGVIVLSAACPEGLGNNLYVAPFEKALTLEQVFDIARANYSAPVDHAILLAKVLRRNITVLCYCPGIEDKMLKTLLLESFNSLQEAVDSGLNRIKAPRLVLLESAQALLLKDN